MNSQTEERDEVRAKRNNEANKTNVYPSFFFIFIFIICYIIFTASTSPQQQTIKLDLNINSTQMANTSHQINHEISETIIGQSFLENENQTKIHEIQSNFQTVAKTDKLFLAFLNSRKITPLQKLNPEQKNQQNELKISLKSNKIEQNSKQVQDEQIFKMSEDQERITKMLKIVNDKLSELRKKYANISQEMTIKERYELKEETISITLTIKMICGERYEAFEMQCVDQSNHSVSAKHSNIQFHLKDSQQCKYPSENIEEDQKSSEKETSTSFTKQKMEISSSANNKTCLPFEQLLLSHEYQWFKIFKWYSCICSSIVMFLFALDMKAQWRSFQDFWTRLKHGLHFVILFPLYIIFGFVFLPIIIIDDLKNRFRR